MPDRAPITPLRTALEQVLRKHLREDVEYRAGSYLQSLLDDLVAAIPTLSRNAVERILHTHFNYGSIRATCGREEPCPQLFEDFGTLALPSRPTVTQDALEAILRDCHPSLIVSRLMAWTTGAGEDKKEWCPHRYYSDDWYEMTTTRFIPPGEHFCAVCGKPRPEAR